MDAKRLLLADAWRPLRLELERSGATHKFADAIAKKFFETFGDSAMMRIETYLDNDWTFEDLYRFTKRDIPLTDAHPEFVTRAKRILADFGFDMRIIGPSVTVQRWYALNDPHSLVAALEDLRRNGKTLLQIEGMVCDAPERLFRTGAAAPAPKKEQPKRQAAIDLLTQLLRSSVRLTHREPATAPPKPAVPPPPPPSKRTPKPAPDPKPAPPQPKERPAKPQTPQKTVAFDDSAAGEELKAKLNKIFAYQPKADELRLIGRTPDASHPTTTFTETYPIFCTDAALKQIADVLSELDDVLTKPEASLVLWQTLRTASLHPILSLPAPLLRSRVSFIRRWLDRRPHRTHDLLLRRPWLLLLPFESIPFETLRGRIHALHGRSIRIWRKPFCTILLAKTTQDFERRLDRALTRDLRRQRKIPVKLGKRVR